MSVKIDDFKAAIADGLARSNRYRVEIPAGNGIDGSDLNLLCDSVTWPGRNLLTHDRYTDMRNSRSAYAFNAEDVTISFLVTNEWKTWEFLREWQNDSIQNMEELSGYIVNYKTDYVKDVTIHHLSQSGVVGANRVLTSTDNFITKSIKLKNAYPSAVTPLQFGNGNENEVLRCTATLIYDNWEII